MTPTHLIAFDFDGVICDGLREYFQTTCRAYAQIWLQDPDSPDLQQFDQRFYQLRPVIETGWEMPVLLRVLIKGITDEVILENWTDLVQEWVKKEQLHPQTLAKIVDTVRDQWIQEDLEGWLSLHRFYPGMIELLQSLENTTQWQVVIITTKEGRFVRQLLQQGGLTFDAKRIFGKEVKQPKAVTLSQEIAKYSQPERVWFIEDRLKTLEKVSQEEGLKAVRLFLADWGYNTAKMRQVAEQHPRIQLTSVEGFTKQLF